MSGFRHFIAEPIFILIVITGNFVLFVRDFSFTEHHLYADELFRVVLQDVVAQGASAWPLSHPSYAN